MSELVTIKCLACGRKTTIYSGHVHKGQKIISVGWCPDCAGTKSANSLLDPIKGCNMKTGCFGIYKKQYGLGRENI